MTPPHKATGVALRHPGIALAGIFIIVGSFLPWGSTMPGVASASRTGIEGGGGVLTLLLGAIAILVSFAKDRWAVQIGGTAASLLAGVMVYLDGTTITPTMANFSMVGVGAGVWTVAAGAVIGIVSAVFA